MKPFKVMEGWQPSPLPPIMFPKAGIVRVILDTQNARVEQYSGASYKVTPLLHPDRWDTLLHFYLATGYRLLREEKRGFLLEGKKRRRKRQQIRSAS